MTLERLDHVRDIDLSLQHHDGGSRPGSHANAQQVAASAGRLFPLSLASEGSAQIGGVLATNAGGTAVLAYGSARNLALGLEVVLARRSGVERPQIAAQGQLGYDLKDLLIGSEGTLGIITAAVLRLFPRPAPR